MKRFLMFSLAIALLSSLIIGGCAPGGPAPAGKTLKVGIDIALSGPAAAWGIPIKNGCVMVVDDINARGGLDIGGENYRVELIIEDSLYTPEGAAAGANRLLDQGVDIAYASLVTHTTLAAQEILEPAKVLTIGTADNDATIIGKKYAFRAFMSPYVTLPGMFNYLA